MSLHYGNILAEATRQANIAGDKWVAEHTKPRYNVLQGGQVVDQLLDDCGMASIVIKDKHTKFAKWVKTIQRGYNESLSIDHRYRGRQEWGLNQACITAALKVLKDSGIKGLEYYTRID